MHDEAPRPAQAAIRTDLGAVFVSMELSRSNWLVTSLSPGAGEKMSKHSVAASDVAGLLERFARLKQKALARTGQDFPIIVIQEAGLDGFWIHRVLESEGIESHVVDAASILTSRRRRRAMKVQISRELDRLENVLTQLEAVETERDALIEQASQDASAPAASFRAN